MLTKIVNGVEVVMSAADEAAIRAEWEANANRPKSQEQINQEAREYLAQTDWYVVRFAETGVAVPQDILDARQQAREAIV